MADTEAKADETAASPADLRGAKRFTLLLRAAKLVSSTGEFLCVLRDASASGIKARLFHDLPDGASFELELGSGERHPIEPVWQRDGHAGFRFSAGPIDVHGLIEEGGTYPKRQVRLRFTPSLPIMLVADGIARPGRLCDISQHGAMVEAEVSLPLGQLVRIEGPDLPVLHARVRWQRSGASGLVFQEGFRLDELAMLAGRLQLARPSAAETGRQLA